MSVSELLEVVAMLSRLDDTASVKQALAQGVHWLVANQESMALMRTNAEVSHREIQDAVQRKLVQATDAVRHEFGVFERISRDFEHRKGQYLHSPYLVLLAAEIFTSGRRSKLFLLDAGQGKTWLGLLLCARHIMQQ